MSRALEWAEQELAALEARGLRRVLEPLEGPQGPRVRVGGAELINFSSNDYLGLAGDPRLAEAAAEAARKYGTGSGASRLVVGDTAAHRSLEKALADFEGTESALLFNSGYAANVGVISTLVGPEDAVFSDALNHASIVDGCRLSKAKVEIYPHLDVAALDERLARVSARRKLVVTDSVFSMDGDLAPLRELAEVCRAHGAALMVDEAHATGVLGETGAGLCEAVGLAGKGSHLERGSHFASGSYFACGSGLPTATGSSEGRGQETAPTGRAATGRVPTGRVPTGRVPTGRVPTDRVHTGPSVDLRMGTLGKSLGAFGAYVACAGRVREWLFNRARSLVFSTSLPPPTCAAAERAVRIVQEEPERRARLWSNVEHFARGLRALGLPAEARSAIFPVVLGTPERALEASAFLRGRGLLVKAIRPPTVPAGTSRLRFALSARHGLEDLDRALEALREGNFGRA